MLKYVDKQRELYTIADKRAVFRATWEAQPRQSDVFEAPGGEQMNNMLRALDFERPFPYSFNWVVRRDPSFMAGGDMPRYALVTTRAEHSINPPFLKVGDLRLRVTAQGQTFWLDERGHVQTEYHPWGQIHEVDCASGLDLQFSIRAALVQTHAMAVEIAVRGAALLHGDVVLDLYYGGMVSKTPHFLPEYFHALPGDEANNTIQLDAKQARLSVADFPFTAVAMCAPAGDIAVEENTDQVVRRVRFRHCLDAQKACVSFMVWIPELGGAQNAGSVSEAIKKAREYYAELLAPYDMETPDPLLDAAFHCGVVNMDYTRHLGSWLEGIHEWNCFFSSNYQISAALSLGQYREARQALRFFCDAVVGPGDCYLADGQSFMDPDEHQCFAPHIHEGLPYYILQLYRYWQATGDVETLKYVWEKTRRNFEHNLDFQDQCGSLLLNFKLGCNVFMYQADHLHLPGMGFSPSVMAVGSLELMARLAEALGEKALAQPWRRRRDYMQDELMRRFWKPEEGRFVSGIDPEGHRQQAAFYTDYIFPELYTDLPREATWLSLAACDRDLWKDAERMRIGNYYPVLFGNSAVQPAQSCEAAEAYFQAGKADRGALLLHDAARSTAVYTDSPGSFAEYQSESGYGLPDYGFGNPTGSYVHAVISGLFGLEKCEGGTMWHWHPALPAEWGQARLRLPECEAAIKGIAAERCFTLTLKEAGAVAFSLVTPGARVVRVTDDRGTALEFQRQSHPAGSRMTCELPKALCHQLTVNTEPLPVIKSLAQKGPGHEIKFRLPATGLRLMDPQTGFAGFSIEGENLTAQFAQSGGGSFTFFLENRSEGYTIPVVVQGCKVGRVHKLPELQGTRMALNVAPLCNSNGIYLKNLWRGCLFAVYDLTPHLDEPASDSRLSLGNMNFHVVSKGQNVIWLDRGGYGANLKMGVPGTTPARVRIPVQALVGGFELLMASEAPVRVTGMEVASLIAHYPDGGSERVPLVYGRELDCASQPFATCAVSRQIGDRQYYMATAVALSARRWVESLELVIEVGDYNAGILAINGVG